MQINEKPAGVLFLAAWTVFFLISVMYFVECVTLTHEKRHWWIDCIYFVQMVVCALVVVALYFYKKTSVSEILEIPLLIPNSTAIADKLNDIGLTNAERGVAVLMIKGYSQRETADIQEIALATVKGHCTAIYRKSETGRAAQFVSLFVDLLLDEQHKAQENTQSSENKKRPAT